MNQLNDDSGSTTRGLGGHPGAHAHGRLCESFSIVFNHSRGLPCREVFLAEFIWSLLAPSIVEVGDRRPTYVHIHLLDALSLIATKEASLLESVSAQRDVCGSVGMCVTEHTVSPSR